MNGLLGVLRRLSATTTILNILTATCGTGARLVHHFPPTLALEFEKMSVTLLVNQEFAAFEAYASQHLHYKFEELGIVHRTRERIVSEMSGTIMIVLAAGTADLAVLKDSHAGVKETTEFTVLGAGARNFAYRTTYDFLWAEDAELYSDD